MHFHGIALLCKTQPFWLYHSVEKLNQCMIVTSKYISHKQNGVMLPKFQSMVVFCPVQPLGKHSFLSLF